MPGKIDNMAVGNGRVLKEDDTVVNVGNVLEEIRDTLRVLVTLLTPSGEE